MTKKGAVRFLNIQFKVIVGPTMRRFATEGTLLDENMRRVFLTNGAGRQNGLHLIDRQLQGIMFRDKGGSLAAANQRRRQPWN